jgi:hypothetical protein
MAATADHCSKVTISVEMVSLCCTSLPPKAACDDTPGDLIVIMLMATAGELEAAPSEEDPAGGAAAAAGTAQAAQGAGDRDSEPGDSDAAYDPLAGSAAAADSAEGDKPAAATAAETRSNSSPDLQDGTQPLDEGGVASSDTTLQGKHNSPDGTPAGEDPAADDAGPDGMMGNSGSDPEAATAGGVGSDGSSSQPRAVRRYPDQTGPSDSNNSGGGSSVGGGSAAEDASEGAESAADLQDNSLAGTRSSSPATGTDTNAEAPDAQPSKPKDAAADTEHSQTHAQSSMGESVGISGGKTDASEELDGASDLPTGKRGTAKQRAGTAAQIEEFAEESGSSGEAEPGADHDAAASVWKMLHARCKLHV